MYSIYFQNPAKNVKSGVDSRGGGTQVREGELQLGGEKYPFPRVLYEILCIVTECHINEYVYL